MKKFIPLIILVIGALVFVAVYFLVIKGKSTPPPPVQNNEDSLPAVSWEKRPIISFVPTSDGHYLNMKIDKISIDNAKTMDYEFVYQLPDGGAPGISSTVTLDGSGSFTRQLLFGTVSSGKYRYDEGVEEGTLTLRFRDDKGKVVAKFVTQFHLQTKTDTITSLDGNLTIKLPKTPKATYFVIVNTVGVPSLPTGNITQGPYGFYTSATGILTGTAEMKGATLNIWDGSQWTSSIGTNSLSSLIFLGTSQ